MQGETQTTTKAMPKRKYLTDAACKVHVPETDPHPNVARGFSACAAGPTRARLIQCWSVSDWRQIQARIRKARTSADPPGQLAALYERTRDAMVAFELAQIHEKAGTNSEAARWYTAAAERFRRAQWKQKAEEALTRLGAPIPVAPTAASVSEANPEPATRLEPVITEFTEVHVSEVTGEPDGGQQEEVFEQPVAAA